MFCGFWVIWAVLLLLEFSPISLGFIFYRPVPWSLYLSSLIFFSSLGILLVTTLFCIKFVVLNTKFKISMTFALSWLTLPFPLSLATASSLAGWCWEILVFPQLSRLYANSCPFMRFPWSCGCQGLWLSHWTSCRYHQLNDWEIEGFLQRLRSDCYLFSWR